MVVIGQLATDHDAGQWSTGQLVAASRGSANVLGSSSTLLQRAVRVSANAGKCTQMLKITGA